MNPDSRLTRLVGIAIAFLLRRRRARRQTRRAPSSEQREIERAVAELEATEAPRPGDPIAPDELRKEESERIEQRNEKIRRRRAEPPPTRERSVERHPGSEWIVIFALLGGGLAGGGFMTFYVAFPDTQLMGLMFGLGLACFAVAAIVAGKRLVPQEKAVEEYHYFGDAESQEDVEEIVAEAGEGISRRKLIFGAAGAGAATFGIAAAFPLASLGPNIGEKIYATPWKRGRRVVDSDNKPIPAEDVVEGTFLTGFPENADTEDLGSPILLLRFPPDQIELPPGRAGSAPEGIIAFSKICTHAGCAVSMFRDPKYRPVEPQPALVCPCHFSTFDPLHGGRVLFGPAPRSLPQLPLRINGQGYLEAAGEFYEAIGPSYGGSRLRPGHDVKPPAPDEERAP